jgi:hypothetical protein
MIGLLPSLAAAAPEDFPSPTGGSPTPLLFLHALVNYNEDPLWTRAWEQHLQTNNSLRVNVGSVTADDFLTDVELHITEPIDGRFRALYDMRWWDANHVNTPGQEHFLGFELDVTSSAGLQLQVHPVAQKEDLDLRTGVLLHTPDREQYVRALVRWDDVLFTRKNDRGGQSDAVATRFEWAARGRRAWMEAFSRGDYGSEGRQSFPDSAQSPVVQTQGKQRGYSETRLRLLRSETRFGEVALLHHRLFLQRNTRGAAGSITPATYRNDVVDVAVRGFWSLDQYWAARAELHRVQQHAEQTGIDSYDYERTDWMPAVFVQWRFLPSHQLELGYLAADYTWTGSPDVASFAESGRVHKLELGWLIDFSKAARMQVSLSHEPDPQRFGGGNIQVQMSF